MNLSAEDIKLIGAFGGGGHVQLAANRERKSERVSFFLLALADEPYKDTYFNFPVAFKD